MLVSTSSKTRAYPSLYATKTLKTASSNYPQKKINFYNPKQNKTKKKTSSIRSDIGQLNRLVNKSQQEINNKYLQSVSKL